VKLRMRLTPNGKIVGYAAKGLTFQTAGERVDKNGVIWQPVVVYIGASEGRNVYLK